MDLQRHESCRQRCLLAAVLAVPLFLGCSHVNGNTLPSEPMPSPVQYFDNGVEEDGREVGDVASNRTQDARFGYPITYDTQGYGVGGTAIAATPLRIDLGGVLLGTVVGLGAVLFIPKLIHLFSAPNQFNHGYNGGGYGRSDDSLVHNMSGVIARLDQALGLWNTSACLQRMVCSYGHSSPQLGDVLTSNALVGFLVDGSRFKEALKRGQGGDNCASAYPQCPFDREGLASGVDSVLLALNKV